MKKLLIISLLFACSLTGSAQTFFTVDNVRYLLEDDHAVVARQDKELTGNIIIPATVNYGETDYNVTRLMNPNDSESGGGGAFQECEITGITLPESIKEIPNNTFWKCKKLANVTLQGAVTRIGESAFVECEALSAIALPETVTEIGSFAFQGAGLTEFTIPSGVTCLNLLTLADTKITYLEIPATVTRLDRECFATYKTDEQGKPLMRTVKMFQRDCRLINNDEGMPDKGTEFGDMTTVDLLVPKGSKVLYQEYYPWMNMHSITEYGEESGETLVPDQRHVTIGDICYMLKKVKVGEDEHWEAYVDIQPETLEGEITIPGQVNYEGTNYPVTKVMGSYWSMWYGDNISSYYHYYGAFAKTKVTKVTLPASIRTIEHHAFSEAQYLQEVVMNEGITEIAMHAFSKCPKLTTINIPSTVTVLSRGVLRDCPKLTTLTTYEGLTTMDWEALAQTGLETLTIPSTCKLLGYQALEIPNLKTLYVNVKEPTTIQAIGYYGNGTMNGTVFGHDSEQEQTRERLSNVDLIVPLGCAENYKVMAPWFSFRSITDQGSSYLKLNNSVFSAPKGKFTVTNTGNNVVPEYEAHDGWYIDTYTHGLCLKEGTSISFNTTGTSWIYVWLSSSNNSTVKIDGKDMQLSDDRPDDYHYRRYDKLVVGEGNHTITCNTYDGNKWPCVFRVEVQNVSGDYYQPENIGVNIDGINYVLKETVNEQSEIIRTATIARQNTSLSGDIIIPAKVSYAKTVLQGSNWVQQTSYDYDVTNMVSPGFEILEAPGIQRTTDGAFQECAITSISLPATITHIPTGAFNGCKQLKSVTLAEGITTIGGGAFANCTVLEDIYLPETITDMSGYYIFGNCPSLKKVNIPKLVSSLGNGCFMRSGIETFIIPENVTSIGEACFGALWEETNLKSIKVCHKTYSNGSISFPENVFNDISGITLIVPEGTKASLYSQVYPWKDFENIIEYSEQNDVHQYNSYRVKFEEETPSASRRRVNRASSEESVTVGFTPSGVAIELPTEIEKNGKRYLVQFKNIPTVMPADDIVLQGVLTPKGDIDGDGGLSVTDVLKLVNAVMNPSSISDITKYDMDGDGKLTVTDVVMLVNLVMSN